MVNYIIYFTIIRMRFTEAHYQFIHEGTKIAQNICAETIWLPTSQTRVAPL